MIEACTLDTPAGPMSLLADDDVVVAAGFTTATALWERLDPSRRRGHDLLASRRRSGEDRFCTAADGRLIA